MSFWFFTSYARADRDSYMAKFFEDLRSEVRSLLGVQSEDISFIDTQNIEAAEEWEPRLAEALRDSRLCLAMCSQTYFNSTNCGKEYGVFLQRQRTSSGQPSQLDRLIFPVLWVPPLQKLPEIVTRLQYMHSDYPEAYAQEGLRYLMKLNRFSDDYQQFVSRLAQKLVQAGNQVDISQMNVVPRLRDVPSPFRTPPSTIGVAPVSGNPDNVRFIFVVARRSELEGLRTSLESYHEHTGWHWRPYYPTADVAVGLLAQQVASRLKLRYGELQPSENIVDQIRELESAHEIVVLVADAWSIRLPRYALPLQRYDEAMLANCAVLIPWNDSDPETIGQRNALEHAVRSVFPRKTELCPPWHLWDTIHSENDLREKLERVLTEVGMTVLHVIDPQRKAESTELRQTAEQQGIKVGTKPHLSGPGGGLR